jgi:hypothetical protein
LNVVSLTLSTLVLASNGNDRQTALTVSSSLCRMLHVYARMVERWRADRRILFAGVYIATSPLHGWGYNV